MVFDPCFVLGGSSPFEEFPIKEAVGIQGLLYSSFFLHPCFSQGPASVAAGGTVAEPAACHCSVSLKHRPQFLFYSSVTKCANHKYVV